MAGGPKSYGSDGTAIVRCKSEYPSIWICDSPEAYRGVANTHEGWNIEHDE